MAMHKPVPREQPAGEADEMNPHPTYRPAAAPAGQVLPLHRRIPRSRAGAATESRPLVQSVSAAECIQRAYYLEARKGFPTDTALAGAMGVNRSQVTRWAQGRSAQAENAWLLRDLASAVSRLADCYQSATIHRWLFGANPDLDGAAPMDLLRQGRLPEVLMAIEAQTSGAFG